MPAKLPTALIVDDEPDIRELIEITLTRMGVESVSAADLRTARTALAARTFDLCLTDVNLPDGNGLDLVADIGVHHPDLPVAVITAYGSIDLAIGALKAGAFDFVSKPVDLHQLRGLVTQALRLGRAVPAVGSLQAQLIGESPPMRALRAQIARLARSQAPVYVSGESGTGKELVARAIHAASARGEGPFVPVNCGAVPSELIESEFFGHRKGSFTGALQDRDGLFQSAAGGTLFLDEVADLPIAMQVKLLRAIQEKAVRPVGAASESPVDARIICATHKSLASEVAAGRFRQDLFYRLNVIELEVPSLRARAEDIPALAAHVLDRLAQSYVGPLPALSAEALEALQYHDFPGNVRELENVLERALAMAAGDTIRVQDLGIPARSPHRGTSAQSGIVVPTASDERSEESLDSEAGSLPGGMPATHASARLPAGVSLEEHLEHVERELITEALNATRRNRTEAARRLGITFRALRYRLKKLNLD